jgi:hypothetical protein
MWPKWNIFKADIDNLGGFDAAAARSGISVKTIKAWYQKNRTPHWISIAGIAVALGYSPERYQ